MWYSVKLKVKGYEIKIGLHDQQGCLNEIIGCISLLNNRYRITDVLIRNLHDVDIDHVPVCKGCGCHADADPYQADRYDGQDCLCV